MHRVWFAPSPFIHGVGVTERLAVEAIHNLPPLVTAADVAADIHDVDGRAAEIAGGK